MNRHTIIQVLFILATTLGVGLGAMGLASPAQAAGEITTYVNVSKLNLRAGPGFGYNVLKVLDEGQELNLLGRSRNGIWMEVSLPDGSGGWVYGRFLRTSIAIASLPVTEAAGGPNDPVPAPQYSLYMTIEDDQAAVNLQRYPANMDIVVTLSLPDGSVSLTVAQGKTDASGKAGFDFPMPARWPDGRSFNQSRLILTAGTLDQTFSRTATIQYFK